MKDRGVLNNDGTKLRPPMLLYPYPVIWNVIRQETIKNLIHKLISVFQIRVKKYSII